MCDYALMQVASFMLCVSSVGSVWGCQVVRKAVRWEATHVPQSQLFSHFPQLHTFHDHNCLESSTDVFFTSVCSVLVVKILWWGVNAIVISVTASMKRKLSEGNPAICSRWRRRTQDSGKCLTDAKVEMLPSRIGFSQNALELLHQQLVNAFSTWWSTMLPALLAALLAVEC